MLIRTMAIVRDARGRSLLEDGERLPVVAQRHVEMPLVLDGRIASPMIPPATSQCLGPYCRRSMSMARSNAADRFPLPAQVRVDVPQGVVELAKSGWSGRQRPLPDLQGCGSAWRRASSSSPHLVVDTGRGRSGSRRCAGCRGPARSASASACRRDLDRLRELPLLGSRIAPSCTRSSARSVGPPRAPSAMLCGEPGPPVALRRAGLLVADHPGELGGRPRRDLLMPRRLGRDEGVEQGLLGAALRSPVRSCRKPFWKSASASRGP